MFSRLEVMVYNNLKPGKHIFRSSNKVFFTSRQNFEASLTVVHISSVQGCTPTPRFLIAFFDMFKLYLGKQISKTPLLSSNLKTSFEMSLTT